MKDYRNIMSLQSKYKTLKVYEKVVGEFKNPSALVLKRKFYGLIQNASPSNTFNNGKETSSVSAVLFCSDKEVFKASDIIENVNGIKYKVSNSDLQYNGVTGIVGHHSEYNLTYYG